MLRIDLDYPSQSVIRAFFILIQALLLPACIIYVKNDNLIIIDNNVGDRPSGPAEMAAKMRTLILKRPLIGLHTPN